MRLLYVSTLLLLFLSSPVWGKIVAEVSYDYTFSRITSEEGLSQDTVYCITQDKTGYIWIATLDGLNRFDGNNFEVYKNIPNRNSPYKIILSDTWITAVLEDRNGCLWIGTNKGLDRLDAERKTITHFKNKPGESPVISDNNVLTIFEDSGDSIWIGTAMGLDKYDEKQDRFTHHSPVDIKKKTITESIFSIAEDHSGRLWIGCSNGLYEFQREKERFVSFQEQYNTALPGDFFEYTNVMLSCNRTGVLWIGNSGGGLIKFDFNSRKATRFKHEPGNPASLSDNKIHTLCETNSGELWVGTWDNGLNLYDRQTEAFTRFVHDDSNPNSLGSNRVRRVFEDRFQTLWIGTEGGGLTKITRRKNMFRTLSNNEDDPFSLSSGYVYSLFEDSTGTIWIGTENGLNKWERDKGRFHHYRHDPAQPESICSNNIISIGEDRGGSLWIGTSNGLSRFSRKEKKFRHYKNAPANPHSLSNNYIKTIIRDSKGIMWFGTKGGLNEYNPEDDAFKRYTHTTGDTGGLSHNYVYMLLEDSYGSLWIATRGGGLNHFDRATHRFEHYLPDPKTSFSISSIYALALCEDKAGNLWVGTKNGLNLLERNTGRFKHYFESDGLCNQTILAIIEDSRGGIWMSTNRGLSLFNPYSKTFRNYFARDGLQNNEFAAGAFLKNKEGELFFGGISGFNVFSPGIIKDNPHIPPVAITHFRVFNKKRALPGKGITLTHREYIFSIEFAALHFSDPGKNQYAYKMEGFDTGWRYSGTRQFATYTNLAPGNYLFKVKGSNNDGLWNEEGASLKITITPPFWQLLWFKILALLLFFLTIFLFVTIKVRRIHREIQQETEQKLEVQRVQLEKENLQKELELKADFTAMLVHDLRSPLTAILGYAELMKDGDALDSKKTGTVIARSSERMLTLINDMLDLSKFEAGKISLHREKFPLTRIVSEITDLMTPLFHEKSIEIDYRAGNLEDVYIDQDRVAQVVHNLVSNAVKFSPQKACIFLELKRIEKDDQEFQELRVTDEGPGIPPERQKLLFEKYAQLHRANHKGTGLGLAVSRLIIEAHGGEIGFKPAKNGGSEFYFNLPSSTSG
ncbi:MAG: hypothetical protein GY757_35170 [bacterium]|nr:hypothetical protein [bacterium]